MNINLKLIKYLEKLQNMKKVNQRIKDKSKMLINQKVF